MPIKLKKTDIQNDLDDPVEGYIILGFDEAGRLVSKDENGAYGTIVPVVPTGDFDNIRANYLTIGDRTSSTIDATYGLRTVSIGAMNLVEDENSMAQGTQISITGENSHGQGNFIQIEGDNSFAGGKGFSVGFRLRVIGNTSFAFFENALEDINKGVFSDNSAILGGVNHRIATNSPRSIILAGGGNTIDSNSQNSAIIGGSNVTLTGNNIVTLGVTGAANNPNSVYVPKLILSNRSADSGDVGAIRWNGSNFQGYNGAWVNLDETVVNLGVSSTTTTFTITNSAGNNATITAASNTQAGLVTSTTQTIYGNKTFNGSTSFENNITITNNNASINFTGTGTKSITTGGNNHLNLDPSGTGRVGIKNSSPTYLLDVNGITRSDQGFIHPFQSITTTGNINIDAINGQFYRVFLTNDTELHITNLRNGMSGILIINSSGTNNIDLGSSTFSTGLQSVTRYSVGNFSDLSGRYVITWSCYIVGTTREIYINITQY